MTMRELMKPGVMLSNIWPQARQVEGETLRALEEAVALDFFEAIQIVDIPFPKERRQFAEVLRGQDLAGNMAMTRIINLNHLNLSSPDKALRERSVQRIIDELDSVREAGMRRCTLVSGPRPDSEEERKECLEFFQDSMDRICEAAAQPAGLEIQIEPLDYFAHKKMALGTAGEGAAIVRELTPRHSHFTLCLDTAHMALNDEDFREAIEVGRDYLTEFHFCNPCKDKSHESYGDNHLLLGAPGVLDESEVVGLMVDGHRLGLFTAERRPTAAFEILRSERMDGVQLLRHCRDLFERCWRSAAAQLGFST